MVGHSTKKTSSEKRLNKIKRLINKKTYLKIFSIMLTNHNDVFYHSESETKIESTNIFMDQTYLLSNLFQLSVPKDIVVSS